MNSQHSSRPYAGKEITVVCLSGWYSDAARLIQASFQERTGGTVHILDFPYERLYEEICNGLSPGSDSIDVVGVAYQWDGRVADLLADLTPYIENDPEVEMADFVPMVARNCGTWGQKRSGLPSAATGTGLFVRKDIIEKRGLELPLSWLEYLALARQLNQPGIIYGTGLAGVRKELSTHWTSWYWGMGGRLLSREYRPLIDTEPAIESLRMFLQSFDYSPPEVRTWDIPELFQAVLSGRLAMAQLWPAIIVADLRNPGASGFTGEWVFASEPGGRPHLSAWSVGIAGTSKEKDLAWEWVKAYTSRQSQKAFYRLIGIGPTRISVYQDEELVQLSPEFDWLLENLRGATARFRFPQSQQCFDYLDWKIYEALDGRITPEQALGAVAEKWTELLENARPDFPYTDDSREF